MQATGWITRQEQIPDTSAKPQNIKIEISSLIATVLTKVSFPIMTPEEKIKCGNMFGVAKTYKESAELLDGMNQIVTAMAAKQNIKAPGGRALNFDHVILTRIILYGIAIEIYLKALLFADGVAEQRTHEWDKLFSSLPAVRQTEIINAIGETFRADFANLLSANKDIFVKWRYSYEETSLTCDISFVKELSDVLGSIVMKLVN